MLAALLSSEFLCPISSELPDEPTGKQRSAAVLGTPIQTRLGIPPHERYEHDGWSMTPLEPRAVCDRCSHTPSSTLLNSPLTPPSPTLSPAPSRLPHNQSASVTALPVIHSNSSSLGCHSNPIIAKSRPRLAVIATDYSEKPSLTPPRIDEHSRS